jgi:hypothetical protein
MMNYEGGTMNEAGDYFAQTVRSFAAISHQIGNAIGHLGGKRRFVKALKGRF